MGDERGEVERAAGEGVDGCRVVVQGGVCAPGDGEFAVVDQVGVDLGARTGGKAGEAGDVATDGRALGGDGDEAGVAHRDDDDVRAASLCPFEDLG